MQQCLGALAAKVVASQVKSDSCWILDPSWPIELVYRRGAAGDLFRQTVDEAEPDRVLVDSEDDWNGRRGRPTEALRLNPNDSEKVAEHWTLLARLGSLIGNKKINEDA